MRSVVQRVDHASVAVEGQVIARIGEGLLVLLGVTHTDGPSEAEVLGSKLVDLRVFPDDAGRFDRSLRDLGGAMLVVRQFTLFGDTKKGRRPSFTQAAPAEVAAPLVDRFIQHVRDAGFVVETGRFGALMDVESCNRGPFTLIIEASNGRVVSSFP